MPVWAPKIGWQRNLAEKCKEKAPTSGKWPRPRQTRRSAHSGRFGGLPWHTFPNRSSEPPAVWFVQIADKQIKLGEEKDAAFRRHHELMALPALAPAEASKLLVVVIDSFLDFVQKHRNPLTYRWYKDRLRLFI